MKTLRIQYAVLIAAFAFGSATLSAQNFLGVGTLPAVSGKPAASASVSGSSFADGTRAINQARWDDAIGIFSKLADQKGDRADGALYWEAYAENKLGNSGGALETCTALLNRYPASSWVEECGALKIEIRAKNGEPVQPSAEQNDELKLLALATLMRHNEKQALAEIDGIVNGDSSEKLKQGALFIMREHHTDTIYPQIARVSYVEGDVRVSRGEENKHTKDSDWEQAVANLPLETGYSLVTGVGRAEIEFEDDSALYLGENSVLLFNDLNTTAGIPRTEVALLSGTVTLHIKPSVAGEWFVLKTPTDVMSSQSPQNLRISAYMDGIALTALDPDGLDIAGKGDETLGSGKTLFFKGGVGIMDAGPIHPPDFSAWDSWVAGRYSEREKETEAALKASGLASPIPGIADLEQKGTFFSCEPYGTCWKPNSDQGPKTGESALASDASSPQGSSSLVEMAPVGVQPAAPGSRIGFIGKPIPNPSAQGYADLGQMDLMFPCMPEQVRLLLMSNMASAYGPQMVNPALWYYSEPWAWTVCHAGSWIYQNNRYVWVVGKPFHHLPVRWIKAGNKTGFVPIHPYDVKGHLPVNRQNGLFAVGTKGPHAIERMELEPGRRIELLNEPPKTFRAGIALPLARAEEPHVMGHEIKDFRTVRSNLAKSSGIPITFDHRSQTFMMSHEVMRGGTGVTVRAPIGNRDSGLQSRAFYGGGGPSSGAAGWRGGQSSGSNAGGSGAWRGGNNAGGAGGWRGGSEAGGGSRGGSSGGTSSGGGFSHGGGASAAPSGGSSSGGSGGSSGGSSGGHH